MKTNETTLAQIADTLEYLPSQKLKDRFISALEYEKSRKQATTETGEVVEEKIVKRKDIEMKPMDEEEAILEMELLGHSFFVYKDMDTNKTCVLYKRKDGDYGLIETK